MNVLNAMKSCNYAVLCCSILCCVNLLVFINISCENSRIEITSYNDTTLVRDFNISATDMNKTKVFVAINSDCQQNLIIEQSMVFKGWRQTDVE